MRPRSFPRCSQADWGRRSTWGRFGFRNVTIFGESFVEKWEEGLMNVQWELWRWFRRWGERGWEWRRRSRFSGIRCVAKAVRGWSEADEDARQKELRSLYRI